MDFGLEAAPDLDPDWVNRIRAGLAAWYEGARRDLPWRSDSDPYRILVSEMMLVQTTVTAVIPYFERFLKRFPTLASLARAEEADVIKAWEGLGYYRRARQLHAAARAIVERHGGSIPNDFEALRALPGVGRYIAGAVLSFAFDRPVPILEANTQRVLARWLAWRGDLKSSSTQARLWEAAARLAPAVGAGTFNQAFMELGALVCIPRAPMCLVCPVAADCRARTLGLQDELPMTTPKSPPLAVSEACALVRREDRFLVVQRAAGGLWDGFWEFPTIHVSGADPAGRGFPGEQLGLTEGVRRLTGVRIEVGNVVHVIHYTVTKHRVRLAVYEASGVSESLTPSSRILQAAWEPLSALVERPFSSSGRKLIEWLSRQG
jgi:A/G-specific adenine glycosylase